MLRQLTKLAPVLGRSGVSLANLTSTRLKADTSTGHPILNSSQSNRDTPEPKEKVLFAREQAWTSLLKESARMPREQKEDEEQVSPTRGTQESELPDEGLEELRAAYAAAQADLSSKWLDYGKSCYIYLYKGGGEPSETLAAFDLDGTIIRPKSNKRIPRSATDWQFFSVWTKVKVQQSIRENDARFVIFTNQNGVGLGIVNLDEVQQRVELVTQRLNFPCTVLVAIDKDEFRKPRTGMFSLFTRALNNCVAIDHERSFYCGDAIGYPSHSDADIKFAQKLSLPFLTPEKFLRGVKPKLVPLPEQTHEPQPAASDQ